MPSRDHIMSRLRGSTPPGPDLPAVPTFSEHWPADWGRFCANVTHMGGAVSERAGSVEDWILATWPDAKVVVSATPQVAGTRALDPADDPRSLNDVDVAVVRARAGVTETGSVLLTHEDLDIEVLGFLSQHIVVLLDPQDLVGNLHEIYQRPEFRTSRYCVLMTGPSATADIEGTLVHGAQGVRSLTVLALQRPVPDGA